MELKPKRIDLGTIANANIFAKNHIKDMEERLEKYKTDPQKEHRLQIHFCKHCYYIMTFGGGCVCTTIPCTVCGKLLYSGSTVNNMLCPDCARRNQLCARCGADINLKGRRKLELK